MKNKFVVGIDIDGTICSLMTDWIEYMVKLLNITEIEDIQKLVVCVFSSDKYHIEDYLKNYYDTPKINHISEFWEQDNIYNNAILYDEVLDTLRILEHETDYAYPVLISHCKIGHKDSKMRFIQNAIFNEMGEIPFIDTKYKQYIDVDIMVDDCPGVHQSIKDMYGDKYTGIYYTGMLSGILPIDGTVKYSHNNWIDVRISIMKEYDIWYNKTFK